MSGVRFLSTRTDNFLVSERRGRQEIDGRRTQASGQGGPGSLGIIADAAARLVWSEDKARALFLFQREATFEYSSRTRITSRACLSPFLFYVENIYDSHAIDIFISSLTLGRRHFIVLTRIHFPKFTAAALVRILAYFLAQVTRAYKFDVIS